MGIVNSERVVGWAVLKLGKRAAKKKAPAAVRRAARREPRDALAALGGHAALRAGNDAQPAAASERALPARDRRSVPYEPGKPVEEVQRELGLDRVVKLASNEGPFPPFPAALDAIDAIRAGAEPLSGRRRRGRFEPRWPSGTASATTRWSSAPARTG